MATPLIGVVVRSLVNTGIVAWFVMSMMGVSRCWPHRLKRRPLTPLMMPLFTRTEASGLPDPGYGSMMNYEGKKGPLHLKESVYRIDPDDGSLTKVTDELVKPNGLCFSPDYKKLYVADTGTDAPKPIWVWDIDGKRLKNGKEFCRMEVNGIQGGSDGIRADVDGNIWASTGWAGPGLDGVMVFAPNGDLIGQILLPEICSNVCFCGPKRNRLFMTASQSLYAVYVETQGAHTSLSDEIGEPF